MKTKLFTQNSFLVMMIALVLALSVQGITDALTFGTSRSGDLATEGIGDEFKITFSVSLGSNTTPIRDANGNLVSDDGTTRINSSGYPIVEIAGRVYRTSSAATGVTGFRRPVSGETGDQSATGAHVVDGSSDSAAAVVDADGRAIYTTEGGSTRATAVPNAKFSNANRYHFNQEQVNIAVTGASIIEVGTASIAPATSLILMETSTDNRTKLTSSVTLTLRATAAAVVEIDITDTTPEADRPGAVAPQIDFTVYVVGPLNAGGTTAVVAATNGVQRVSDQADTRIDGHFTFLPAANEPVYYTVEGSGRLYVSPADDRKTSSTNNLYTSSSAPVYLDTTGGSSKVTAYIAGSGDTATILYIFSGGRISELPQIEIQSGDGQTGAPSGRLDDYFEVKVTDGRRRAISGFPVTFATTSPAGAMFIPVPGTSLYAAAPDQESIDAGRPTITEATATTPAAAATHHVQTDRNGVAKIYYQLSDTSGAHTVTATAHGIGISTTLTATASSSARARLANLEIVSGDNQRADKGKDLTDPLVVIVRSLAGHRIQDVIVQFRTTTGTLVPDATTEQPTDTDLNLPADSPFNPPSGQQIYVKTGPNGEAGVTYNIGQLVEARTVTAEVRREVQTDTQYDFAIREVAFNVNGTGASTPTPTPTPTPGTITLLVSPPTITGRPGTEHDITITASELAQVGNIIFGEFLNAGGTASPTSGSGTFTSTLTLPSTEGEYDLVVNMGTERRTVTVTVSSTVAAPQTGGRIALELPVSGAANSSQTVRVTVLNAAGGRVPDVDVTLSITSGGGTFSPSSLTTGPAGSATSQLTLGSTPGNEYFVSAAAPNYPTVEKRISITGTQPPPTEDTPAPRTAGEAAAIDVYDGNNQRGIPNTRLTEPLVVEVTDANGDPVSNERVEFRTTRGTGRFSPARPRTNATGRAQTRFTPTSSGTIRISASVAGVASRAVFTITTGEPPASLTKMSGDDQSGTPGNALENPFVVEVKDADGETIEGIPVTFSVTAGGGSLSETSATTNTNGRAQTTLTLGSQAGINSVEASVSGVDPVTFSTSIDAKILVSAANRPVMYWIAGGALYRLAGAKEAKIAESANGVAIGNGKIYWTSEINANSGSINSANLDGSEATTLTTIRSVPIGISVDTANSKLYWTNSRGKIQSANLNGSGIKSVLQNRSDPTDIVVSNGFLYWTEGGDTIRRMNMTGQKVTRDVAANLDTVGGIAVGGGKIYWTEATGANAGTVNGANLNGTNFETLATLRSAPMGISVDTTGNMLYWTNARGRVQRSNLNGSSIKNVVDGLISATKLVVGGANVAEAVTKQPTQPAKKDASVYDITEDGTVDSTDVDALILAILADLTHAKYDVNGDGAVDFKDVRAVNANLDTDAAGAPTIVGMKMTTVQIDRLQEQINLLIATGDRSPAAMKTLIYLQQLIATARPAKTQLLANYPNPFNPETWIPYELATDTNVKITIYNTQGVVVRVLLIGHQSAGYYTGRDRAAYWDGRNALGEQVASGVYFYQFETDNLSSMRKMVILK